MSHDTFAAAPPPIWLAEQLWRWNGRLHQDRHVEELRSTRAQMRSGLQEIEDAAFLLAETLEPSWPREFLDAAGTDPIDNPERLKRALEDLGYRADQARNCPDLATVPGATKPGPGKARPEGMSPHTLCAVMILEAWRHVHRTEPSPKNRRLAEAAEAYWRIAGPLRALRARTREPAWARRAVDEGVRSCPRARGRKSACPVRGEVHSYGDESLAFWRHHFKKAAGLTAKDFREEWRRHLVESERRWQRRNSVSEAA
jgi:hypothetical protein